MAWGCSRGLEWLLEVFMAKTWRDKELSPQLLKVQTNQCGKNAKSIVNPYEQGVLTSFLGLDSLELI
jgi:hypothetical protein